MVDTAQAWLADRGVVALTGADAQPFLDNLVTNDLDGLAPGEARFAALLSPQGKILFEFYAVRTPDGYLLDTAKARAPDLVKRLGMYKLRAKVTVADVSDAWAVVAAWGDAPPDARDAIVYRDPREAALGWRLLLPAGSAIATAGSADDYAAHRITAGVPEGDRDFGLGDAFPHEANYDKQHGVSFTKGCYVGQEVVARMQHKTVVRKRVVRVQAEQALVSGAAIRVGEAVIGAVGTTTGGAALALVRLDRVAEALDKGQSVTCDGADLVVDPDALASYRANAAAKAAP